MNHDWAREELHSVELGDTRLNQRLVQLAESFSQSPESPINQACRDWGETKGAYRFFQNESVDYKMILKGHIQSSLGRCREHKTILVVQDTTYFNYTSHSKTEGLCLLNSDKGSLAGQKRIPTQGLIMHTALALSDQGLPLGILDQKIYSRQGRLDQDKLLRNEAIPIERKDSFRWLQSLQKTFVLPGQDIRTVTICDREADIYDFFLLAERLKANLLVRANQNRIGNTRIVDAHKIEENLWPHMAEQACLGSITITIPKKEKIPSRAAVLEVRTGQFRFRSPSHRKDATLKNIPYITLNVIYVKEQNASAGMEAIEWMLLTNLPIPSFEEAVEKIKWYCLRWRIEVFHKILKSGLKVENCRLSTADRLIRYLSLMSVIAWRIFWITLFAREAPQSSCLIFLNDIEWKILFTKVNPRKTMLAQPPDMKTCVVWIAQLGGFLARKCDKNPGITHVWRGLKRFADIMEGVELARKCG